MDGPLPLTGGPLALDVVNTVVHTGHGDVDLVEEPAALEGWLAAQGDRVPQPRRAVTRADVQTFRTLRDHVAVAVEHARTAERPPRRSLDALTDAQRSAPQYSELGWDGEGAVVTATRRRDGSYGTQLCAHLAEATAELLTSPDIRHVERCAHPDCILLFLPTHPQRRWCSTRCGNRARVARYYRRHKGD